MLHLNVFIRHLKPLALLLLLLIWAQPAQAEDTEPVLPPPAAAPDSPEARETVTPDTASSGNLSNELSNSENESNVDIYAYKRKDGTKIEEYSKRGHVYMVKVSPPGGLPSYYLYDRNGDGQFHRDVPGGSGKRISPPEWVIQRF